MLRTLNALWNDERGFVITAELVLVVTLAVLALTVGISEVAVAINNELNDVSNAIGALDQSYQFAGFQSVSHGYGYHGGYGYGGCWDGHAGHAGWSWDVPVDGHAGDDWYAEGVHLHPEGVRPGFVHDGDARHYGADCRRVRYKSRFAGSHYFDYADDCDGNESCDLVCATMPGGAGVLTKGVVVPEKREKQSKKRKKKKK